jgi:hypothetical protein
MFSAIQWAFFHGGLAPPMPDTEQPALRNNLVTVYYPGFSASRSQASKYVADVDGVVILDPKDPSEEKTLFVAACPGAPRLLHNIFPAREIPELHAGRSWNPLHWLGNLMDYSRSKVLRIRAVDQTATSKASSGRETSVAAEKKKPRLVDPPSQHMHLTKIDIGGDLDQAECLRTIRRAVAEVEREYQKQCSIESTGGRPSAVKRKKIVLFGTSRGAATIFAVAMQLPEELAKYISLVVVEAPFDTVESVLRATSYLAPIQLYLLQKIGTYKGDDHSTPLSSIINQRSTHLQCPIAFITSDRDRRVPKSLTLNLMRALRENHPHVTIHHLELHFSHHSAMSINNAEDRRRYVQFMEHLYDTYCSDRR